MRITENIIAQNFLNRTRTALSRMARAQEQIASGRRLLRPSDDPRALAKSLALRGDLRRVEAFNDNASSATAFMSVTETSLQEVSDLLSRSKELLIAAQNATSDGSAAESQALELRSIVESLMLVANRDVGGRYLFAGRETKTPPYRTIGGSIVYVGDSEGIFEQLGNGLRVGINVTGPQAFQTLASKIRGTVDLDPAVSTTTGLQDLFDGSGTTPSTIRITDGNGVSADLSLGSSENLGQVINAINNAGTAIVATISADQKSLELQDTSGGASFQVQDILGGRFAQTLGIATTSTSGTIRGFDLRPAVSENTPMALVLGATGISPGAWTLRTESAGVVRLAQIDPTQANTVGDLMKLINTARTPNGESLGIRASIEGRSLVISAVHPQTTIAIEDSVAGGSAAALGISGVGLAFDVFALLERAADSVEARDNTAMDNAIRDITEAVERTAGARGTYGARARQILALALNLTDQKVDLTIRLADVEDVDLASAVIELTKAQTVYNASLTTGTRMLELSLFNYIR